mmetsp:Transcript_28874/g.61281  ORF Transcript_28874/g.61281 Transcript_28874/m.61281 type:complete len:149 (-) Transcript_28874:677-1123(-)
MAGAYSILLLVASRPVSAQYLAESRSTEICGRAAVVRTPFTFFDDGGERIRRRPTEESEGSNALRPPSASRIHVDDFASDKSPDEGGNNLLQTERKARFIDDVDDALPPSAPVSVSPGNDTPAEDDADGPQEHLEIHRVAPYHASSRS